MPPEEMLDICTFLAFNRLLVNQMLYVDLDLRRLKKYSDSGKGQLLAFLSWNKCLALSLLVATFVFANSLGPDQDRQNVGPDLDPIRLIL